MNEMIERVARAIFAAENPECGDGIWRSIWVDGYLRLPYERAARAAIAAMREPTSRMLMSRDAGNCWPTSPSGFYRAMIDEALKE